MSKPNQPQTTPERGAYHDALEVFLGDWKTEGQSFGGPDQDARNPRGNPTFEDQRDDGMILCGTPKQVLPKIRHLLEQTRPGIMAVWGNDGKVSQKDSLRCIELLGTEVFPQVREWAKELGLNSPFEADAPVHTRYSKDLRPAKRAAAE